MTIIVRNPDGVDIEIHSGPDEAFINPTVECGANEYSPKDDGIKLYTAATWLESKLVDELLEVFEHTDEYDEECSIESELARIYSIAEIYAVEWITTMINLYQENLITEDAIIAKLHNKN